MEEENEKIEDALIELGKGRDWELGVTFNSRKNRYDLRCAPGDIVHNIDQRKEAGLSTKEKENIEMALVTLIDYAEKISTCVCFETLLKKIIGDDFFSVPLKIRSIESSVRKRYISTGTVTTLETLRCRKSTPEELKEAVILAIACSGYISAESVQEKCRQAKSLEDEISETKQIIDALEVEFETLVDAGLTKGVAFDASVHQLRYSKEELSKLECSLKNLEEQGYYAEHYSHIEESDLSKQSEIKKYIERIHELFVKTSGTNPLANGGELVDAKSLTKRPVKNESKKDLSVKGKKLTR